MCDESSQVIKISVLQPISLSNAPKCRSRKLPPAISNMTAEKDFAESSRHATTSIRRDLVLLSIKPLRVLRGRNSAGNPLSGSQSTQKQVYILCIPHASRRYTLATIYPHLHKLHSLIQSRSFVNNQTYLILPSQHEDHNTHPSLPLRSPLNHPRLAPHPPPVPPQPHSAHPTRL